MTGEILKKRREDLSLNIREITDLLKIKTDYLIAIENNSFEKLPVEVYTKGYIRCYAKYLDVDPEPIIQYYTKHLSRPKPPTIIPIVFSKKKGPKFFYIIPVFFVALVAFFIFSYMPQKQAGNSRLNFNKVSVAKPISEKKEHILNINANEVTWIYIKFGNGRSEEILFQPGESKTWKFSENALLKIGNAGGVKLNFDGKDIGILGKSGQVITLSLPK